MKAYRETHKDMPSEEDEEDGGKGVLHTYSYLYEYMAGVTATMEDEAKFIRVCSFEPLPREG